MGSVTDPLGVTLADATRTYLASQLATGRIGPATARNYGPALRLLVAHGPEHVGDLRRIHIEAWIGAQASLTASSRRTRWSMLMQFLRWCRAVGLLDTDPTAGMAPPRRPPHAPRALEPGQVGRLLRAAPDDRGRAIVALMVWSGLRCCEVARLDLDDVDAELRCAHVVGKLGQARTVPVPDEAWPHLAAWLAERGDAPGPVFIGRKWRAGQRLAPDSISRLVGRWCDAAGIKRNRRDGVSAHALRHTAASDVLERNDRGSALTAVQAMLGHAHLSTTAIYLRRPNLRQLREAMAGRHYDDAA